MLQTRMWEQASSFTSQSEHVLMLGGRLQTRMWEQASSFTSQSEHVLMMGAPLVTTNKTYTKASMRIIHPYSFHWRLCITSLEIHKEGKAITKTWRNLRRKGTHKHTETYLIYFDDHRYLFQSEDSKFMWTHSKDSVTSHHLYHVFTYTYSLLTEKESVIVKIYQISFCVFVCAFPPEISSFFGKNFPFLFPFFVLSVLQYFPFHMVRFS